MNLGRMPACTTLELGRTGINTSVLDTTQANTSQQSQLYQEKIHGNRCFHSKDSPIRFDNDPLHKARPYQIVKAKKNAGDCYFNPLKYDFGKVSYDDEDLTKKGTFRQRRSEFRAFIHKEVLQCILHYTCLKNYQLGWYNGDLFLAKGIDFIFRK